MDTERFFDEGYVVTANTEGVMTVEGANALVSIVLEREPWGGDDGYYRVQDPNFYSDARVSRLYAGHSGPRAPRGYARRMLCWALLRLVDEGRLSGASYLVLEADGSDGDRLVGMYERMGFKFLSADRRAEADWPGEAGGLMGATVAEVLEWCAEEYESDTRQSGGGGGGNVFWEEMSLARRRGLPHFDYTNRAGETARYRRVRRGNIVFYERA